MTPDPYAFSSAHWGEFIALLSMDLTDPVWPMLGFAPLATLSEVRTDLRAMINRLRARAAASPEALPDIRHVVFDENDMGWPPQRLEGLATTGAAFLTVHADDLHGSGWDIALNNFPKRFHKTIVQLGDKAVYDRFDASLKDPLPKLDASGQLSPWDLELCARHGWNPHADDGFPPLDATEVAMTIHRTRAALNYFRHNASPGAQDALLEEARTIHSGRIWRLDARTPSLRRQKRPACSALATSNSKALSPPNRAD